ncbi:hypothetical protein [Catenulispora rubra]|uniref:hypothetical protein n=1 Tax=Catenulispora rubra TaxID=280293 RepID=UPI00189238AE|nr:hypothetical protein [Catenulispora rubra]
MPKIDWNPGRGRRGRPLRRVLGMGQQQGLLVMYGIAAVVVIFALAAAFGAVGGASPNAAGASGGANTNSDGSGTGTAPAVPKDSSKSTRILLASVQHYADLLASGQKIVGHTSYPGIAAYGQAFSDPKSPPAQFVKFRTAPDPEGDTTYLAAASQAAAAYGGDHGGALDQWTNDMAKAKSDLGGWIVTAVRYQQGAATQATLDAAAATVTQDLATAKSAASSL